MSGDQIEFEGKPVITFEGLPAIRVNDACCPRLVTIVKGAEYDDALLWDMGVNVDGEPVNLRLQGNDFTGTATGRFVRVPLTSQQTNDLECTTHERSEYRLSAGGRVIVGRAEII